MMKMKKGMVKILKKFEVENWKEKNVKIKIKKKKFMMKKMEEIYIELEKRK